MMEHLDAFSIGLLIWQLILVLGFITLIFLAIKLYIIYMKYLHVKTKYLEQKMRANNT